MPRRSVMRQCRRAIADGLSARIRKTNQIRFLRDISSSNTIMAKCQDIVYRTGVFEGSAFNAWLCGIELRAFVPIV